MEFWRQMLHTAVARAYHATAGITLRRHRALYKLTFSKRHPEVDGVHVGSDRYDGVETSLGAHTHAAEWVTLAGKGVSIGARRLVPARHLGHTNMWFPALVLAPESAWLSLLQRVLLVEAECRYR